MAYRRKSPMIPVLKAFLPTYKELSPYLEAIDRNQVYSNFGPLNCELTEKLADHFGVKRQHIICCSSGTSGLQVALLEVAIRRNTNVSSLTVGIPNWTFQATVQAALSIGMKVKLLDVTNNGELDMSKLRMYIDELDIIMPVSPFGAALDYDTWTKIAIEHRKDIVFDAAAAFFTLKPTNYSSVISTHATKGFATGEGGIIVVEDDEKAESIRSISSFGFAGSRVSSCIGINAKMSEYSSAVGLAMYNKIGHIQAKLEEMASLYNDCLLNVSGDIKPLTDKVYARTTYSIKIPQASASASISYFANRGIEIRSWWGDTISSQPIGLLCDCTHVVGDETVSNSLSKAVMGIPFGLHLTKDGVRHIFNSLESFVGAYP